MAWINASDKVVAKFLLTLGDHTMSSTFSPEPEEESLETNSSDTDASEPLKLSPTASNSCETESETKLFPGSLSGTTSVLLTGNLGEENLT